MDKRDTARRLRHYGLEALQAAAEIEAEADLEERLLTSAEAKLDEADGNPHRMPEPYEPFGDVVGGIELLTGRWACCGGFHIHADYCRRIAHEGLISARAALHGVTDRTAPS